MDRPAEAAPAEGRIRARNRAAILAAATRIFVEKGFDGASIAAIATAASLPKANVYYYFKDKEAIYRTLIADLLADWDRALNALDAAQEPAEAIAAYVRAKLDFSRRRGDRSRMFANEVVHGGRFLGRRDRAHIRAVTAEKAAVFQAWAAAGKMDPLDPAHLFILLWGGTQYYADFAPLAATALGRPRLAAADWETAAETIIAIILKGCGIRPSRGNVTVPSR